MQDSAHILQDQVRQALADKQPLYIRGGGSKRFYGRTVAGESLKTSGHTGIVAYEPTELVLTARSGTRLRDVESALAANGQILACEPPHFGPDATLGGMVAAGLSGPARPYRAAVQDTVLGCTLLNGQGEILRFGGNVMKNVAGYDVSRLLVGSLGCLGVLLDITVKVIPAPKAETSVTFTIERDNGAAFVNDLRRQGLPVTAACQCDARTLQVRFSAGREEIATLPAMLDRHYGFVPRRDGGDPDFWRRLREHQLPFFDAHGHSLWRLSVPVDTAIGSLGIAGEDLLSEWGGALHWFRSDRERGDIFAQAAALNGHATCFRPAGPAPPGDVFQPLADSVLAWHERLKQAFDPAGLFNPGRMYAGL